MENLSMVFHYFKPWTLQQKPQEWRQGPPVAPEQRWNFWPALPIAPYERRLTKRYEVVPGNGDVANPQISTKKPEFQATRPVYLSIV